MNLIDERNKRTVLRKIAKKEYDEMITLSVNDGEKVQTVRLLDEGAVVMANGEIDFYIAKGTLEKFMSDLPEDYEGTINLGHMDFATFPILLGTWTKADLHLVDIGDGRKGLDVDLRLDKESVFVKELSRMPYSLGVSAEFMYHIDEKATKKIGVEIIDDIFIRDFAIVGEAGNVGSSDIQLKGGTPVTLKELNEKLGIQELEVAEAEAVDEEVTEEVEEVAEVEETEEAEETAEVEEAEEAEETEEAAGAEPEEKDEEEPVEEPEEDALSVAGEVIDTLMQKVAVLEEQVIALTADKENAEKALAVEVEKAEKYGKRFANLKAHLADEPKPAENMTVLRTDGIGEW